MSRNNKCVFSATDLGRTASHYYVKCDTVQVIMNGEHNVRMKGIMTEANVLDLVCHAKEFSQIKVSCIK